MVSRLELDRFLGVGVEHGVEVLGADLHHARFEGRGVARGQHLELGVLRVARLQRVAELFELLVEIGRVCKLRFVGFEPVEERARVFRVNAAVVSAQLSNLLIGQHVFSNRPSNARAANLAHVRFQLLFARHRRNRFL